MIRGVCGFDTVSLRVPDRTDLILPNRPDRTERAPTRSDQCLSGDTGKEDPYFPAGTGTARIGPELCRPGPGSAGFFQDDLIKGS